MRGTIVTLLLAAAVSLGTLPAEVDREPETLAYDIVDVKGKLLLEAEPEARRLEIGDRAVSGDRLRTGWSSRAELEVASRASRFLLGPRTRCTLAHDRPGVLLHVERGRLRAVFDAFTGEEPRLVTTPSAVLAVRGTEYGLWVAKDGDTHLVVFAGVVEVTDPAGTTPPVRVEAGHETRIVTGRAPEAPTEHRITPQDWDRGRTAPPPGIGDGFERSSPGSAIGSPGAGSPAGKGGSNRRGG